MQGRHAILRAVPSTTSAPSPESAAALRLELSGSWPRAVRGQAEAAALQPLDALLLAWLIVEGPTPRERLAQLLWPGSELQAARNALRQRLFRLRRQCGTPMVTGAGVIISASRVT